MKKKWPKIISKTIVASTITALAIFFAETSAYACTIWYLDQPEIPKNLILKD